MLTATFLAYEKELEANIDHVFYLEPKLSLYVGVFSNSPYHDFGCIIIPTSSDKIFNRNFFTKIVIFLRRLAPFLELFEQLWKIHEYAYDKCKHRSEEINRVSENNHKF